MKQLTISRQIGHWPFCGSKTGEFGTKMTDLLPSEEAGWLACEVEADGCSEFLVLFPRSEMSFENYQKLKISCHLCF